MTNNIRDELYALLKHKPYTTGQLREATSYSTDQVKYYLKTLAKDNLIKKMGKVSRHGRGAATENKWCVIGYSESFVMKIEQKYRSVWRGPVPWQMPQIFINNQRVGGLAGLQAALKQVGL